jgi:uncharacterized protein (DUF362 family)
MRRRSFLQGLAALGGAALLSSRRIAHAHTTIRQGAADAPARSAAKKKARVALINTTDRADGTRRALDLLGLAPLKDKRVFLKPNFNSADPTPGSTHPDTLRALVQALQRMGAASITVGDRSGMGDTRGVMEHIGVFGMADELGFKTIVFDELSADDWDMIRVDGSHWSRGFALPKVLLGADVVVQTCCLKTHRYGGHFTLSLKNSVGLAAKFVPGDGYNYMTELHSSGDQRRMIAEINAAYRTDLIVMDGVQAFVDGGPDRGKLVEAGVVLAATDRIAIDAVGVAILRHFGTTPAVSKGAIFDQEQIARAAALNVGVSSPAQIEIVTDDAASAAYGAQISAMLLS